MGKGGFGSVHHTLFLPLLPPQGEKDSHASPCPAWGPSHGRQSFTNFSNESFPWATVLHELLQHGSHPWGAVLQEQTAPAWVPRGVTSPASKPASAWAPLSTGPRVRRFCQEPAPARASHGVTASFGHPPAPAWGPPRAAGGYLLHRGRPWAAGGQPAAPWSSPRAAGESLSAPAPGAPPPPPSSLTLVSAELFLSHLLTPLSLAATATPL